MELKEMAQMTYADIQKRKELKERAAIEATRFRYEGKYKCMNRNYKNFGRFK